MNRPDLTYVWATDSTGANVPVDPDTDTTNPSYVPNVFIRGWIAEKPQEAWNNYLYQGQDVKVLDRASGGFAPFDASVVYKKGSILADVNGFAFGMATKDTSVATDFEEIVLVNAATFNADVQSLIDKLRIHAATEHAHQETAAQIGVYIKSEIDKFFNDITNPKTITYHVSRTGAAHNETALQVGSVPASGGNFTGDIVFQNRVLLGGNDYIVGSDGMVNGNVSIKIDNQRATLVDKGIKYLILTKLNFIELQNKFNGLFALPSLYAEMLFRGSISNILVGDWTLEYDPARLSRTAYTFSTADTITDWSFSNVTVVIKTNVSKAMKDYTTCNFANLKALVNDITPTATQVEQIQVYPKLSVYQKSMA